MIGTARDFLPLSVAARQALASHSRPPAPEVGAALPSAYGGEPEHCSGVTHCAKFRSRASYPGPMVGNSLGSGCLLPTTFAQKFTASKSAVSARLTLSLDSSERGVTFDGFGVARYPLPGTSA